MGIQKITQGTHAEFKWIDLVSPKDKEIQELGKEYQITSSAIKDCLDPKHLPKYEHLGGLQFIILRAFDEKSQADADNVQELTRKLAIFIGKDFALSIHRKDQKFLQDMRMSWNTPMSFAADQNILESFLVELFNAIISSYEAPIDASYQKLETLEGKSFLKGAELQLLIEEGYYLKRQLNVIKRVLRLTQDVLNHLHQSDLLKRSMSQDLKENSEKLLFQADDILENVNTLLNLYISLQTHKTNEIMRALTVMSVIVLPLNLIAGIYGMNFENMPELRWEFGYPFAVLFMLSIGIGIFYWSKKKGWL